MSSYIPSKEIKNIVMNLRNCPVEILNGSALEIQFYSPNPQKSFEVVESDDCIILTEPEGEEFTMKLVCNSIFDSIKIKAENSNIFLNRIEAIDVEVNSEFGDIEINGSRIKNCLLETKEGGIIIENKTGFEKLDIINENGDVDLYIQDCAKQLNITTEDGEMDVVVRKDFDCINLKSNRGDIFLKVREVEGCQLNAYTHYGLIDDKFNKLEGKNVVNISTEEGDIKLRHR